MFIVSLLKTATPQGFGVDTQCELRRRADDQPRLRRTALLGLKHKQLRHVLAPRLAGAAPAPDTQDCCPVCFLLAKRNGNLTKRPPNRGDLAGAAFLVNPATLVDATILACEGDQCTDALLRII